MLSNPSIGGDLGIARRIPDEGAFLDKTVEGLDAGPQELIGAVAPNWVDRANRLGVDPDGYTVHPGAPSGWVVFRARVASVRPCRPRAALGGAKTQT